MLCALALTLVVASAAPPAARAGGGLPSVQAAASRYGDALLVVYTSNGARAGTGFLVATRGVGITSIAGAQTGDDVVVELSSGERRKAKVIATDTASPLVAVEIVRLDKDAAFAALGILKAGQKVDAAAWLLGLDVGQDGVSQATLGGLRKVDADGAWHIDLPCSPGAPILDQRGRVVAVATARAGQTAARGVSVDRVRALVGMLATAQTAEGKP
jgi:hypothetical protein